MGKNISTLAELMLETREMFNTAKFHESINIITTVVLKTKEFEKAE